MLKKSSICALLTLVAVCFLTACSDDVSGSGGKADGKVYKIGVITSLTGDTAEFGQEQKKILDYRVEELNKKNRFKIELVYEDGQCEVGASAEGMRKLVDDQKIQFVIGGLCSTATFATAPLTKDKKVLLVSATTSNNSLEGLSPRTMSISYPDSLLAEAIAKELSEYNKIATLSEKAEDSDTLEQALDDLLFSKYKDTEIVFDEKVERETVDLTELINKIQKSGADVIWLNPSSQKTALAMLQALEKAQLKVKLLGQFGLNDQAFMATAPAIVNGMVIFDAPTVRDSDFLKYRDQIIAKEGPLEKINAYYTAATIDVLDIMTKLVSENNADFESVEKALTTGTFTGYTGNIHFGGKTFAQGQKIQKLTVKDNQIIYE